VAGLLETGNLSGRKVAVVISGANIDMATLAAVLRAP
jgi:threonine dehydratase